MNVGPSNNKYQGLVADLLPNHRMMEACGHFLFKYIEGPVLVRKLFAFFNLFVVLFQYVAMMVNLGQNTGDVAELTANSVTVLFFTHCVTKYLYVASKSETFYRTWGMWNQPNTHPIFAENDARYHSIALAKQRKLLVMVASATAFSVVAWTTLTMFGDSVKGVFDKATNETLIVEIPRLPLKATYPWDAMHGFFYYFSFVFQVSFRLS